MDRKKEKPYEPAYKGFDVDETRRAQETAERSREVQAGKGESVDADYVDEGPREAAERMGRSEKDVGDAVERARRKRP
ncbi:MAG: hypothetical protein QOE90_1348 [Thermoplasmata archaeon]|jgi:hypothetical protein|nr:hypothetical protein [Thermoplasmata archaeon]